MAKKKGLLDDFDLGDKQDEDVPVVVGDYLEEAMAKAAKPVFCRSSS
ncbi:MAG: hypothetical protein ACI8X5_001079 [Planctomycetota bacterium]|jgi:hypothetical protein